jgi:2-polyprenyl-3-methyl-5-hydroxy-6-metoxy-1,4-benzoquinol methylase
MASSTGGVEYFERETALYGGHADLRPEFAERYELITAAIDRALAARSHGSVAMDIGCGRGHLTCELARRATRTIAVDGSQAMLDATAQRVRELGLAGVEFRQELLPLPEDFVAGLRGAVDLIVLSSVIEYIERDLEVLYDCRQMLGADGTLLASFPNARSLYWIAQRRLRETRLFARRGSRHQVHQYRERELRRFARGVGFSVESLDYFSLPVQRFVPRRIAARPKALATLMLATMRPAA